jgi:hypothetical protein
MRSSQKITRIHLSFNEQDIPVVFGIVTAEPDYKISLNLNKKLNISLRNSDPVEFQDNDGNVLVFSRFSDASKAPDSVVQLVSNRSKKSFLLKKLKNIDYLLLMHDEGKYFNPEQVMLQIRAIDSITGVFNIDLKTIKDKNLKYLV